MRLLPRSALLLLTLLAATTRAQFEVIVTPEKSGYLLFEPVTMVCRVKNTGAAPVTLGESATNATVRLVVRGPDGRPPAALPGRVLPEPIPVEPLNQATFRSDLSAVADLRDPGLYSVQLEVRHGGFVYTSAKASLTVSAGTELAQVVGLNPPRLFLLRTAPREEGLHFYVRIDDPAQTTCYGVYEVDRFLAGRPVEKLFDNQGRLHLLHPSAPDMFTHSVFQADGKPVSRERVRRGFAEIGLARAPDGSVRVVSGDAAP
jgi:hypothetical protein